MSGITRVRRDLLVCALVLFVLAGAVGHGQREHVVAPGDTLYGLAARYGTTIDELRRENSLSGDLLRVGQLLSLPVTAGFSHHSARAGETLASVAERFGLEAWSLALANPALPTQGELPLGSAVRVPPVDGVSLMLGEEDSLLALAVRYSVAPGELLLVNGLADLTQAVPGEWLLLPAPRPFGGPSSATGAATDPTAVASPVVSSVVGATFSGATAASVAAAGATVPGAAVPGAAVDGLSVGTSPPEWHALAQAEALRDAPALLDGFTPLSDDFVMPLAGSLSSTFGWRDIAVAGNRFHGGIDLAVDSGTPVAAARDGMVIRTGWIGAYGYAVYLEHGDSLQTRYAHLSRVLVVPGELVRQGDVIALAGNTGASTGPHLHFEIRLAGLAVDPLPLLR
jgi:murein DD-endopeptidase MepM/ murein hydrolase activator NlpD